MTVAIPYNRPATSISTRSRSIRAAGARVSPADGAAVHICRLIQSTRKNLQVQLVPDARGGLLKVADEGVHDGDLALALGPPIVGQGSAAGHMMSTAGAAGTARGAAALLPAVAAAGVVRVEHGCRRNVASWVDGFVDNIGIFEVWRA